MLKPRRSPNPLLVVALVMCLGAMIAELISLFRGGPYEIQSSEIPAMPALVERINEKVKESGREPVSVEYLTTCSRDP